MTKDIVFCRGLELDMEIGFHEIELGKKQTVLVDLDLEANFAAGPTQDRLEGLVDYHTIACLVQENVASKRYQLLEALAVDIAHVIVVAYPHVTVRVRVQKTPLNMPRVRAVGVECVRSAADFAA